MRGIKGISRGGALALLLPCALVVAGSVFPGCEVGDGVGSVVGTLNVDQCIDGPFNLAPDFFAAVPFEDTLQLRIQNGGDYETFSDGVEMLIDSITLIRGDATHPSHLCHGGTSCDELGVSLPVGVTPPGVPIKAVADPAIVHMALYLESTCHTQDAALYVLSQVTLDDDGTCTHFDPTVNVAQDCNVSGVDLVSSGDAGADASSDSGTDAGTLTSDAGGGTATTSDGGVDGGYANVGPIGTSYVIFDELFDGNIDDESAAERLSQGRFDVYLADPREVCPGGLGPPPRCRGHLTGNFKFYFKEGRPAQPFPGANP
jgi:hypothetical protein